MAHKRLEDDKAFEAVLSCSECLSRLREPKLLGCSHSFCQSCVQKLVKKGDVNIKCPICKRLTTAQSGVGSLLDDFRYHQFVDSLRAVNLEDYQAVKSKHYQAVKQQVDQNIQIFVSTLTGRNIVIEAKLGDYALELKKKIETKLAISPEMQRLIFVGKQLRDGHTLREYGIQNGSTLQLLTPILRDGYIWPWSAWSL